MTNTQGLPELAELLSKAWGTPVTPLDDSILLEGEDPQDRVLIERGQQDGLLHLLLPLRPLDENPQSLGAVVDLLLQLNADVHQLGQARMAYHSASGEFMLMDCLQPDLAGALAQIDARRVLARRVRQAILQLQAAPEEV
jgi:hypothetical protein